MKKFKLFPTKTKNPQRDERDVKYAEHFLLFFWFPFAIFCSKLFSISLKLGKFFARPNPANCACAFTFFSPWLLRLLLSLRASVSLKIPPRKHLRNFSLWKDWKCFVFFPSSAPSATLPRLSVRQMPDGIFSSSLLAQRKLTRMTRRNY